MVSLVVAKILQGVTQCRVFQLISTTNIKSEYEVPIYKSMRADSINTKKGATVKSMRADSINTEKGATVKREKCKVGKNYIIFAAICSRSKL